MELSRSAIIDISIITFNSAAHLPGLFESLLQQDYPLSKLSILLADHGSSDDSWQQVRDFSEAFGNQFHRLVLRQDLNRGFGEGHNRNLEKASSPFVLVCNADIRLERNAISNALRIAQDAPDDVVAWEFRQFPSEHPKYYHPIHRTTLWNSHACVLLRLTALREVGGYERRFFMYGEDVDLSLRLRASGYRLWYCRECVVEHVVEREDARSLLAFKGMLRANLFLRLRFGSLRDVIGFGRVFVSSFFWSPKGPGRWLLHFQLICSWIRFVGYFMGTRPGKNLELEFRALDYGLHRSADSLKATVVERPALVSVIVRTHGEREHLLTEAIQSIADQSYRPIEIVVAEDGSEQAGDCIRRCDLKGCQLRYYPISKRGRSAAGNYGLKQAQGEWLMFLDDDDLIYHDHIETLTSALEEHPLAGAAYAVAFEMATDFDSPRGYEEKQLGLVYNQPFSRTLLQNQNYLPIQTVLFRRALFECYGGFAEDMDQLEDWNLWARYAWLSDFAYVNRVTSMYRVPWRPEVQAARQRLLDLAFRDARRRNLEFQRRNEARSWRPSDS